MRTQNAVKRILNSLLAPPSAANSPQENSEIMERLDALEVQVTNLANDPRVSGRLYSYADTEHEYVIYKPDPAAPRHPQDNLPVPPDDLWWGYAETSDYYVASGHENIEKFKTILAENGYRVQPGHRILDFGCAAGRMIRAFHEVADVCEVWGTDISAPHIEWCQQYLNPPFHFVTTTTMPHLPFEDRYFDLIYCGSVFTHIADLADAWILELRRILRPGGKLLITVHDNHTIEKWGQNDPDWFPYQNVLRFFQAHNVGQDSYRMITLDRKGLNSDVFYDIPYIRHKWGRIMPVLAVVEEGYFLQTVLLLERPA